MSQVTSPVYSAECSRRVGHGVTYNYCVRGYEVWFNPEYLHGGNICEGGIVWKMQ